MISSIVWLYFVLKVKMNMQFEHWCVYLPVAGVELFILFKFIIPKKGDWFDRVFDIRSEGE